jgi:hypothetical protein
MKPKLHMDNRCSDEKPNNLSLSQKTAEIFVSGPWKRGDFIPMDPIPGR